MSSLASEQLSGDSFMTSFPQGGVLRHQLAHLELTLAKEKELAASLLSIYKILWEGQIRLSQRTVGNLFLRFSFWRRVSQKQEFLR